MCLQYMMLYDYGILLWNRVLIIYGFVFSTTIQHIKKSQTNFYFDKFNRVTPDFFLTFLYKYKWDR